MYSPISCRTCNATLFYPDEVVVGTWNGGAEQRFDTLDFDDYEKGVPDGYEVYCLDDAPCECEYHPPFMSDRQAVAEGYCFVPECEVVPHKHPKAEAVGYCPECPHCNSIS